MFKKLTLILALVAAFCFNASAAKLEYSVSFVGAGALPSDWTVLDNNTTKGSTWYYDNSWNNAVTNYESKTEKADDYFISPAFALEAGKTYVITTRTCTDSGMSSGDLFLRVGTSTTDASTFSDVQQLYPTGNSTSALKTETINYTPSTSGTYHFAFYSNVGKGGFGYVLGGFEIVGGEEGGSTVDPEPTPGEGEEEGGEEEGGSQDAIGGLISYNVDFTAGAGEGWTTIDNSPNPVNTWAFNDMYGWGQVTIVDTKSSSDDYYVSPAFSLIAGEEYTIKTKTGSYWGVGGQTLTLKCGKSATDASSFTDVATLTPTTYYDGINEIVAQEIKFTPTESGVYYFAFHTTQIANYTHYSLAGFSLEGGVAEEGGEEEGGEAEEVGGPFTITEDFEDASHFTESATVPNGWLSTGSFAFGRDVAVNYGLMANSGSHAMVSKRQQYDTNADEVIYTPVKKLVAGKEYKLSFYYYAPGGSPAATFYQIVSVKAGTAQTADAQTIDLGGIATVVPAWTKYEFAFTPEVEGEYCFSIAVTRSTTLNRDHGQVAFDDFEITGEAPEAGSEEPEQPVEPEEPEAGEPVDFTIFEDFEDDSHFTANAEVPEGWVSEGSYWSFRRSSTYDYGYMPKSGSYSFNTANATSLAARDEVFYTPMMNLVAGEECKMSFYVYSPGGSPSAFYHILTVKAGTAQSADAQTIEVGTVNQVCSDWTEYTFAFTPETAGEYCFSVALSQSASFARDHGVTLVDDVTITGKALANGGEEPEQPVEPEEPEAEVKAFEVTENFDEVTASLPEGWVTTGTYPFAVASGVDYGVMAKSSPNVLATVSSSAYGRNEVIYTPMYKLAAGKEAKIKLNVYADGNGTTYKTNGFIVRVKDGQSADANTVASLGDVPAAVYTSWTEFEFVFTPEADGEYCFSLSLQAALGMSGTVAVDDVTISGYSDVNYGGGDDDDDDEEEVETVAMPYSMSVAEGQPADWTAIGAFAYDESGYKARYPTVCSEQSWQAVDAYYVSPAFAIEEGKTYKVTTVTSNIDESNGALKVMMGKSATDVASFTTLATLNPQTEDLAPEELAAESFTFTAEETGAFYMAFNAAHAAYDYGFYVFSFAIEEYEEIIPVELPYAIDFTAAANTEWTTIDMNGSLTWDYVATGFNMEKPAVSISAGYGVMEETDDYYVSPAFNLEAGKTYKVSTRVADGFNLSAGTLNLQIGTSAKDASTYSVVSALSPVYSWNYETQMDVPATEIEVTVEEDGVYYFAIYQSVAANVGWLYSLIDFAVEEVVEPVVPEEPEVAPLYIVGAPAEIGAWDPANSGKFEFVDGEYTITLDNIQEFKMSTVSGDWTEFNTGNLAVASAVRHDTPVELSVNKDGANIVLPWAGKWTITVSEDLSTMTAVAHAIPSFPAQVYMVGHDNAWDPTKAQVIKGENGIYKLEGYYLSNATIKLSKAKGNWDTFNASGINPTDAVSLDKEIAIKYSSASDIKLPSTGWYTITIDMQVNTIKFEKAYPNCIYAIGNVTANPWNTTEGEAIEHTGNGVYVGVINVTPASNGLGEFSFATILSDKEGDWDTINSQPRFGSKSSGLTLSVDESTDANVSMTNNYAGGTMNWKLASGTYTVTVDIVKSTLKVELGDKVGIEDVEVEEVVEEALYFNLQGVQVVNPEAGKLYIVVRGNKVTKEIIR